MHAAPHVRPHHDLECVELSEQARLTIAESLPQPFFQQPREFRIGIVSEKAVTCPPALGEQRQHGAEGVGADAAGKQTSNESLAELLADAVGDGIGFRCVFR